MIKLFKVCHYKDGVEDMFYCPLYFIYTEVHCEKDAEYFEQKGWHRRLEIIPKGKRSAENK